MGGQRAVVGCQLVMRAWFRGYYGVIVEPKVVQTVVLPEAEMKAGAVVVVVHRHVEVGEVGWADERLMVEVQDARWARMPSGNLCLGTWAVGIRSAGSDREQQLALALAPSAEAELWPFHWAVRDSAELWRSDPGECPWWVRSVADIPARPAMPMPMPMSMSMLFSRARSTCV